MSLIEKIKPFNLNKITVDIWHDSFVEIFPDIYKKFNHPDTEDLIIFNIGGSSFYVYEASLVLMTNGSDSGPDFVVLLNASSKPIYALSPEGIMDKLREVGGNYFRVVIECETH